MPGINIVQSSTGNITFRRRVVDGSNNPVSTGTAYLRVFHLQSAGTFREYRFDSHSFVTGSTYTQALTHRTMTADANFDSSATDSGWWTWQETVTQSFQVGERYIASTFHSGGTPKTEDWMFQWGGGEGDFSLLDTKVVNSSRRVVSSIQLFGTTLHLEVSLERYGITQTTPSSASAQIFSQGGVLVHTVSTGAFGTANARGVFSFDQTPHALTSGQTYQFQATISDGGDSVVVTKPIRVLATGS